MKEQQERILAYVLAKELEIDKFEQVSGGVLSVTHTQKARATGGSGQGVDVVYEHSFDF